MARTATRELAFTMVFQSDFGQGLDYNNAIAEFSRQVDPHFLHQLVEGVQAKHKALDKIVSKFSRGWTVDRLPRVDRAILRLAVWELLGTDTPPAVVINEAVDLAKEYGNTESPGFVNGILDNIKDQREELVGLLEG
jgi:N utilization substance protein B